MTKIDAPLMAAQLNALCEVFEKKPVSSRAAEIWFDTLKEFPTPRVMDVLNSWAKTHSKFPTPADVWKAVNEICISDRERKAEAEARENKQEFYPGVGGEQAEKFIAQIRKLLKGPTWTPMEHWQRVLENPNAGYRAKELAKEAIIDLGSKGVSSKAEREPGQDDEERKAA